MILRTSLIFLLLGGSALAADAEGERTLFTFAGPKAAEQWQTVNDGVMGGRSTGRFEITKADTLRFFGTLSLENNGGFASVRTRPTRLQLQKGESLVARIRGDGREYSFNLYVPRRLIAFSYRAPFKTKKDEWIEVELPLDKFVATSFGRVVRNQPLDPGEVNGLGILLGDKKAGPFQLEIEWIKAVSARSQRPPTNVRCEGTYPHHLQGICADQNAIYWSFTTMLVKTDRNGKLLNKVPVANHHGDLCHHDGKLYVAVNLGKFNDCSLGIEEWTNGRLLSASGRCGQGEGCRGSARVVTPDEQAGLKALRTSATSPVLPGDVSHGILAGLTR